MKLFIYTILLFASTTFGQQNLVPNGSFERYNPIIYDALSNQADPPVGLHNFPAAHLATYDTTASLFRCWEMWVKSGGSLTNVNGIVYGIIPNFYPSKGGNSGIPSTIPTTGALGPNDDRILYSDSTAQRIQLISTPNNLIGLDCSPPNSTFATGMNAQHGNSYLALMDFKYEDGLEAAGHAGEPYFGVKLKQTLLKNIEYKLEFSIAKMNRLDDFQNNQGWSTIKDPEIQFHIGNLNTSGVAFANKQPIHKEEYSNENWEVIEIHFTPNRDADYLRINLDQFNSTFQSIKLTGCLLDNIKIYEACETALNQCNNTNWKRDLLDAQISNCDANSGLAFPDPNQNNKNFLKTIKAENLENVKRLELRIASTSTGQIVRTIDEWYPQSEYVWGGNDDNGIPVPEGDYVAFMTVSNDCFHITNADTKFFQLKRKYTVFGDVQISSAVIPTNNGTVVVPAIKGLEKVHWLRVIVANSQGQEVFNEAYYDPPAHMLLSTSMGDIFGNPSTSIGNHTVYLEMSNNCQSDNLGNNWDHTVSGSAYIDVYNNYSIDPNLFNWVSVPKPDFPCPFDYNYLDNYLSPRDCCEGNLYIDNVAIYTDFGVQIQNDIIFGDNVSFGVNSTNSFYAGGEIYGEPGLTIPLGANVLLEPGTYTCVACREMNPNSTPRSDADFELTDQLHQTIEDVEESSQTLFPNPVKAGDDITVTLLADVGMATSYILLDGVGKRDRLEAQSVRGNVVTLTTPPELSDGMYYLQVNTGTMIQTFKVQVKN